MAKMGEATITVHLDILLNGEPITKVFKAPAELEELEGLEGTTGLVLHANIDAMELARILYPMICEIAKGQK